MSTHVAAHCLVTSCAPTQARCSCEADRQHLLAIIEASFGMVAPFDKLVSEIFATELRCVHMAGHEDAPHTLQIELTTD